MQAIILMVKIATRKGEGIAPQGELNNFIPAEKPVRTGAPVMKNTVFIFFLPGAFTIGFRNIYVMAFYLSSFVAGGTCFEPIRVNQSS